MSYTVLERQLNELARLKNDVFGDIEELRALSIDDDEAESIESKKSICTKRAHHTILQMNDLLSVLDISIAQFAPRNAENEYLYEKLALQKQTVSNLKEKLRESQLKAYEQESERIHGQIVKDYVEKWKDENKDAREQLFAGRSEQTEESDDVPIEVQVLKQNKNITNSLKITKQFMTMSVMQSELQIESFDQSTKDLSKFNDKLTDLESVLNKSRQIVKFIEKQDRRDKRRIYLSIGFLLLCFAWVIWHRILKVPVKLLTWTLLKMFGVISWFTARKEAPHLVEAYSSSALTPTAYSERYASVETVVGSSDYTSIEPSPVESISSYIESLVSEATEATEPLLSEDVAQDEEEGAIAIGENEVQTTTTSVEYETPTLEALQKEDNPLQGESAKVGISEHLGEQSHSDEDEHEESAETGQYEATGEYETLYEQEITIDGTLEEEPMPTIDLSENIVSADDDVDSNKEAAGHIIESIVSDIPKKLSEVVEPVATAYTEEGHAEQLEDASEDKSVSDPEAVIAKSPEAPEQFYDQDKPVVETESAKIYQEPYGAHEVHDEL